MNRYSARETMSVSFRYRGKVKLEVLNSPEKQGFPWTTHFVQTIPWKSPRGRPKTLNYANHLPKSPADTVPRSENLSKYNFFSECAKRDDIKRLD